MRQAVNLAGAHVDPWAFTAAAAKSRRWLSKVDILLRGNVVYADVPVSAGSVTVDRRAQHRTRASGVTFPEPPGGVPTASNLTVAPAGHELRIWRGIAIPGNRSATLYTWLVDGDGVPLTDSNGVPLYVDTSLYGATTADDEWWVCVGTLPIWSSQVDVHGVVTVEAWDRSQLIAKNLTAAPFTMTAAETLETRLAALVEAQLTWLPAGDWSGATHPAPPVTHERGSDPWKLVTDHAAAVGYETYFDSYGMLRWRPEPDLRTALPVRDVVEGGVLLDASLVYDREQVVNSWRVVATNSATSAEYVGLAEDNNPASPTYVVGPFGRQVREVRDDLAASQADVDASAAAKLAASLGLARSVSYDTVPNPLIEPGDAERVRRVAMGLDEVMLVDAQTIGLGPEAAQSHEVRARQDAL